MKTLGRIKIQNAPEAAIRAAIEHCGERLIRPELRLSGVVLTGSFARGEGSFIEENGRVKVLGDIEFLGVVEDKSSLSALTIALKREEGALSEELDKMGVECKIDVVPALRRYFRTARPSIFAYELRAHGQLIAGDSAVLGEMPVFGSAEIPRLDAFYLLNNRIMEQLENYCALSAGHIGAAEKAAYGIAKFYLDLATSILTFEGAYVPTYRARAGALKKLKPAGLMEPEVYAELLKKIDYWTGVKLNPSKDAFAFSSEQVLVDWKELAGFVHVVWQWELSALLGAKGDTASLARSFAGECPRSEAAIHWLKLVYRAMRMRKLRGLAGARLTLRHPRHLLYMNAALRYFHLAGLADGQELAASIESTMPLNASSRNSEAAAGLVRFWTDYFRNC